MKILTGKGFIASLFVSLFVMSIVVLPVHAYKLHMNRPESSKDPKTDTEKNSPGLDLLNDLAYTETSEIYKNETDDITNKDQNKALDALFNPTIEAGAKEGATAGAIARAEMAKKIRALLKVSKKDEVATSDGKTEGLLAIDKQGEVRGAVIGLALLRNLVQAHKKSKKDLTVVTKRAQQFLDHELNHALNQGDHGKIITGDMENHNTAMGTKSVFREDLRAVNPLQSKLVAIVDDATADKDKLEKQNISLSDNLNAAIDAAEAGTMFLITTQNVEDIAEQTIQKIKDKGCFVYSTKQPINKSDANRYENLLLGVAFARQVQVTDVNSPFDIGILYEMFLKISPYTGNNFTSFDLQKLVTAIKEGKTAKEIKEALEQMALPVAGEIVTNFVSVATAIMKVLGKM